MPKEFATPHHYKAPVITGLKQIRKKEDGRKKNLTPSVLQVGQFQFAIARHFGFCFGVENAVDIAFRAIAENPDKRIFLLSEMIHNATVNKDLTDRGVRFLQTSEGEELIPIESLQPEDVVILPAFGVTLETEKRLLNQGISPTQYNTTCPFVERVWKKAAQLAEAGFTIVIHGKPAHEETRATFSHAAQGGPAVVIRTMEEAQLLAEYIVGKKPVEQFFNDFPGRSSSGFDPSIHLKRVGVVNQTTMLAEETRAIAQYIKEVLTERYGEEELHAHYADTRDTLCYATSENQSSVHELLREGGEVALVIGGTNSSNTSHLAKLCAAQLPTYHIQGKEAFLSPTRIRHFLYDKKSYEEQDPWITHRGGRILLTAGASTPDSSIEEVITCFCSLWNLLPEFQEVQKQYLQKMADGS